MFNYEIYWIYLYKPQSLRYENWRVMNALITISYKTQVWKTNVVTGDKHFMARRKLHNCKLNFKWTIAGKSFYFHIT